MEVLQELATRVLPLYIFIVIGWVARRKWNLGSKWISKTLLYVLIPLLIIENLLKADLEETAVAGAIIFILAFAMNVPAIFTKRVLAKDYNESLLKGAFSYYNIGWFGIPVVMALFGEQEMPLIISAYMGNVLYGDSIGFYMMSRTKDIPAKEAVKKVLRIPAVYACILAIVLNLFSIELPEAVEPVGTVISWTVSALGMLIIGVTLAGIDFKAIAYGTLSKILGVRYVSGALILILLVFMEHQFLNVLEDDQQKLMLLMATFPIAANLVVFASVLDTEQENAALLVGTSSLISLLLVPLISLFLL